MVEVSFALSAYVGSIHAKPESREQTPCSGRVLVSRQGDVFVPSSVQVRADPQGQASIGWRRSRCQSFRGIPEDRWRHRHLPVSITGIIRCPVLGYNRTEPFAICRKTFPAELRDPLTPCSGKIKKPIDVDLFVSRSAAMSADLVH